ncbi:phosphonate transport system substrate-binding protein [Marisediminitalea aggregata]|uniref:Phosphonate transport system substrate-binding protein n=1 Tax=Marisediminitalea aggregata TaxID=634436 RepID=A0A1M5HZU8_9ALTE|nr:phosphate/phosphite/phosphonate ABC transporter substrate-binding protein [Marisediminitalea aggregata]MAP21559.1 phosphate ABC transporter substrate-binding protein [Alteromonadaceae bacterium]MEC7823681.1 phosphate/phosphite/phosphonate ABC transporter substrate-binding protein [Pseudomonadota bacterium]HBY40667.1 phosphate ABC transporter substrate-binding protein [Alteromonas sp.]MAX44864.1 phosphate ABC transporter substrate-binding protein [Alteromonadaceae bacterium]SHG21412.1 phosph|tara:strand:- start:1976 stop:2809 length:834 start_codon:yes stop_codon:yes gene_type:complete
MKLLTILLFVSCSALAQQSQSGDAGNVEYSLGIVPQQSTQKLATMWLPLIDYLNAQTGFSITFSTAKDIPTFEDRVAEQEYDLAYINPYHYVVFSDSANYVPLARDAHKRISGIIVVREDSPYTTLQQLHGATLAFPAPAAFAASIIPRGMLAKENISINAQYVNSHDSVYLNVINGLFPAGGGIIRTLEHLPKMQNEKLRILWRSQDFTPHALAVHSRVPEAHRKKILAALIALNDSAENAHLLRGINFSGFAEAQDSDWDDVRELGILSLSRPYY